LLARLIKVMAGCTLSLADVSFALQACPTVFDFSLQFEQLIVSILPNSLIFIAAVFALFADRSYTKHERIKNKPDPAEVGLSKSRKPAYADRYHSVSVFAGGEFSSWYLSRTISKSSVSNTCFQIGFISLFALQLTIMIQWATEHETRPTAAISSAFVSLLATAVLGSLSFFHQRTSAAPSTIVEGSLFFSVLFEAIQTRSYWLRSPELESLAITTSISLATRTFTLLVEAQPQRRQRQESSKKSVELAYGFLGQVSFWWLNPLFLTAWKAVIPMSSLWSVDAALSSNTLAEKFSALKTGSWTSRTYPESCIIHDY
jgi:hypothetical protein